MRIRLILAQVLMMVAGAACTKQQAANRPDTTAPAGAGLASDPAQGKQAIEAANARLVAALRKGDTAAATSFYADDAIVMLPNEMASSGRDAVVKSFKDGVSRFSLQMSAASGNHAAMLRSIELLGTEVAPSVRHAALNAA